MATKRPDTIQGSTPTLSVRGDMYGTLSLMSTKYNKLLTGWNGIDFNFFCLTHFRDDSGSIHIEVADSGIVSASSDTKSEGKNTQAGNMGKERWIVSLQHPEHPIARYLAHVYPRKLYIILIILDTQLFHFISYFCFGNLFSIFICRHC